MKSVSVYIADITEAIVKIQEYTKGSKEDNFLNDTKLQDSVIRRLEIMGEAVKHIPADFRNKYPEIPWKEIAGMRDILIHEYSGVLMTRIWKVVKKDIPRLKKQIKTLQKEL